MDLVIELVDEAGRFAGEFHAGVLLGKSRQGKVVVARAAPEPLAMLAFGPFDAKTPA